MVQLKLLSDGFGLGLFIKFQFHNGTIKTPIDIYNGNLVFTEVSLRINVYFFAVKMSMYNESIFADLRQHLHLIFIVKG